MFLVNGCLYRNTDMNLARTKKEVYKFTEESYAMGNEKLLKEMFSRKTLKKRIN